MMRRLSNLLYLPVFLASFAIATLAINQPSNAAAQQPTCNVDYVLEGVMDCFYEQCSLSISYINIRKPACGGCCIHGTATVTCDTSGTTNYNLHLCASCGQSNVQEYYCPTGGIQGQVIVQCKTCP